LFQPEVFSDAQNVLRFISDYPNWLGTSDSNPKSLSAPQFHFNHLQS